MNGTTFVLLSFEGPDRYSHAGGLGSRVRELSSALADMGFETHLFFIGDPDLPGLEVQMDGRLVLHRWCQWISRYHSGGVYDGEEGKIMDWSRSLPSWIEREILEPRVAGGDTVVVMAEEWHTVASVLALREVVARRGWERQVHLLWNLNNPFGIQGIDWHALKQAAVITTVSRYMKHLMWSLGVDARVLPNGIAESWFEPPDPQETAAVSRLLEGRLAMVKVARWDPDKRWNMTIDAIAEMKRRGLHPLLLARGGVEMHRSEVMDRAARHGLDITRVSWEGPDPVVMADAIRPAVAADVIDLQGYLHLRQLRVLYLMAAGVLANSGMEPFGLVGLEAMACGGLAFVGCTGEDYATPGYDVISIQTDNYREIAHHAARLHNADGAVYQIRQAARQAARRYTWPAVIQRTLIPLVGELAGRVPVQAVRMPREQLALPCNGRWPCQGEEPGVLTTSGLMGWWDRPPVGVAAG